MTETAHGPSRDRACRVTRIVRRAVGGAAPQLLLFSLFINLLSLAAPLFVLQVYDRVLPHAGMATLYALLIGVVAAIAFDFVLKQARSRVIQMVALRVDAELSRKLFSRLSGLPLAQLEARSDAEWRLLLRDSEAVRDAVAGPTTLLVVDLPFALLFIGAIAFVAPPLAGVLMLWIPVYLAVAVISSRLVARAAAREQEAMRDQAGLVGELVAGRREVLALGMGAPLLDRWDRTQAASMRGAIARGAQVDAFSNLSSGMAVLTGVTITTMGAIAIIGLDMTMGGLVAANMLAARVVQPLSQIVGVWRSVTRFQDAAARLNPVLAEPCEKRRGAVARPRPKGVLRAEKACLRYPGGADLALERVSLTLKPGMMTGIIGENGSGKSTLLKAMLGLYPLESGRVTLDGEDIAQFGRDELSEWIGYAPQEPFLFEGTVRENIARGRSDVTDEAVRAAAESAGAAAFIGAHPDGYGADVGEGGGRFSPGRRQRIALARALVANPSVVLLDEPSANLDIAAEAALIERLRALKDGCAVVVVSHSLPLLAACDMVVAMHDGRVAMSGRASELLPRVTGSSPAPGAAQAKADQTPSPGETGQGAGASQRQAQRKEAAR